MPSSRLVKGEGNRSAHSSRTMPGLILTPPDTATEEDDGYLSASEIAALKLDADWVILSACNTAAGAATRAEALSGLARAFIYGQARALLVSHWEVYSDATVKLITTAIREMARDPEVGRAEALRRSMLTLIDKCGQYRRRCPLLPTDGAHSFRRMTSRVGRELA